MAPRAQLIELDGVGEFARRVIDACATAMHGRKAETRLCTHGLRVNLHAQDRAVIEAAQARVVTTAQTRPDARECDILAVSGGFCDWETPPILTGTGSHTREFETALAGTPLRADYSHEYRVWQIADLGRGIGVQWRSARERIQPWEAGAPLRPFLHWFHAHAGRRLVHAGTLGHAGIGVLLAGKGGSGKSGTVAGGLAHGLDSVGDDYVLVERAETGLRALPVYSTLKQDAPGLERIGKLREVAAGRQVNWQDKYEFDSTDIGGKPLCPALDVRAILLPSIAPGTEETSIVPVSRSRAMLALAPSGLFQMPGDRDTGVELMAWMVRALPCHSLRLGPDPREATSRIAAFIEELRQ